MSDTTKKSEIRRIVLVAFALSGMAALIYEMVWIRPFSLIFGSTVYATSTIIAAFLGGLALGSWLFSGYADEAENPLLSFAWVEMSIGIYGLLTIALFNLLPRFYLTLYNSFHSSLGLFFLFQFLLSFAIVLIPTTLMGATWPLVNQAYVITGKVGSGTGSLYSVNNLGAIIGTLAAGFLLIPLLGIKLSILVAASVNLLVGLLVLFSQRSLRPIHVAGAAALLLTASVLFSYNAPLLNTGFFVYASPTIGLEQFKEEAGREVRFYEEGLYGSVLVTYGNGFHSLRINGKVQCASSEDKVDNLRRIAALPLDLFVKNYGERPKSALNLGLGCGITSGYLAGEGLRTTTVEIDPTVVEASEHFRTANHDVLKNPNHRLVVADARNWLALNDESFDLITIQPADPWVDRSTQLFSQEFFLSVRDRLTERGVVSQWVPVFEMSLEDFKIFYNTFHSAFPHVYIYRMQPKSASDELLFIGSPRPLEVEKSFFYLLSDEEVPEFQTVLNTDDRPVLEFSTARTLYEENPEPILETIQGWRR